jgi:4-amino-4-deoxy-L-arabinose transferase-like glycosyltransferase
VSDIIRVRAVLTDRIVWITLAGALALRLLVAVGSPYLPDETERSFPLADSISFAPDSWHLPIRGPEHPALPSYIVKASQTVFGMSPLGRRAFHVGIGMLMIVVVAIIAHQWQGLVVARWAVVLLAVNEYQVAASAYATAKGPHLLFVALSLWAFASAIRSGRPRHLWLATAGVGLAFYSKEYAALLLPIYAVVLWLPGLRGMFRLSHQLIAAGVFALLIAPDVVWHLLPGPDDFRWTYGDHLARITGISVTPGYLMFYLRDVMQAAHVAVTGRFIADGAAENPSMNSLLGAVLLAGVCWATFSWRRDATTQLLLLTFWSMLGFFVFFAPDAPDRTPYAWYWIDITLFPATLLAAHWLTVLTRR